MTPAAITSHSDRSGRADRRWPDTPGLAKASTGLSINLARQEIQARSRGNAPHIDRSGVAERLLDRNSAQELKSCAMDALDLVVDLIGGGPVSDEQITNLYVKLVAAIDHAEGRP